MLPEIILEKEAENNGMAVIINDLIRQNLEQRPEKLKPFKKLSSVIGIEANDIQVSLTLNFQKGKLTIFNGINGKPKVKILTSSENIINLSLIKIKFGLPYIFDEAGRGFVRKLITGELKIIGLFLNLITLIRLTKVFSVF